MQLGRLEVMDQNKIDNVEKISQIQTVDRQHTIVEDERYKNLEEGLYPNQKNEVLLDNIKFGFDTESKEFFVRVVNEGVVHQYPTDQMMRLKTHLNQSLEEKLKNK